MRWWNGPLGLGWRQGLLKLGKDELSWRRRLSFRRTPNLTIPRSALTFLRRSRAGWQDTMWVGGGDVLIFATLERQLEVALLADSAAVVLEWLGTPAERPSPRVSRRVRLGLWLAVFVVLWGLWSWLSGSMWTFPRIAVVVAIFALVVAGVGIAAALVASFLRRPRLVSAALRDEFVATTREVFAFVQDFGFPDVFVQRLPWKSTVVFRGTADRFVAVTLDQHLDRLELEMGHRSGGEPRRLSDVLADAGHPDPDRVTRYAGADGPLRNALEANAHALRLWCRSFLTEETAKRQRQR